MIFFLKIFSFFADFFLKVERKKIAFVVKKNVPFSGNVRILADFILEHEKNTVVVCKLGSVAGIPVSLPPDKLFRGFSVNALIEIYTSSIIFLSHSGRDAMLSRRKAGRRVINLWHGVAIKKIEHLMPRSSLTYKSVKRRYLMRRNSRLYDAMIASSDTDRLLNSLAFGVDLDKICVTGLPRFDYLSQNYKFPEDLQLDIERLDAALAGRTMVLYAPTFREVGESALHFFSSDMVEKTKEFFISKNMVLGIRPHPYDQKALSAICDGEWIIDLRPDILPEPAIALRAAQALIVDYSSIWVDYLLLKRPIVGFMPDIEQYITKERGFIYDFQRIFPGEMSGNWMQVLNAIDGIVGNSFQLNSDEKMKHDIAAQLFLPPDELRFKSTEACVRQFLS